MLLHTTPGGFGAGACASQMSIGSGVTCSRPPAPAPPTAGQSITSFAATSSLLLLVGPSQACSAAAENSAFLASDDAAALESMMRVMNSTPGSSEPSRIRYAPEEQTAQDVEGHDALAFGFRASIGQVTEERPDPGRHFEDFWADLDTDSTSSAILSKSAWKLVDLCLHREAQDSVSQAAPQELSALVQHFFIGDTEEEQDSPAEEVESFEDFWAELELRPQLMEEPEQAWKLVSLCRHSERRDSETSTQLQALPSRHLFTGVDDYALDERHNPEALFGQAPSISESRAAFWGHMQPEMAGEPGAQQP
eukprot:TRINITY_DN18070_c0_g1_i1.p1 TRINITY_DN18070_c0_g1~~TRINITY_DN18070_c0_g1_i1.p1  ORF type:complete len:308 (-),score=57.47 TRINITY_DN18070_c0_g1_i1:30-953(-)